MTSHDLPLDEVLRILEEDRNRGRWLSGTSSIHVHNFNITIDGQSRTWNRCSCGEWEQD